MQKGINKNWTVLCLEEARDEIDRVISKAQSGELDDLESIAMGCYFQPILENLCLAWHCKWTSNEDINGTDAETDDIMRDSIPNWGLSFRLVDIDEPREFDRRESG
jgi:hypothetical protein